MTPVRMGDRLYVTLRSRAGTFAMSTFAIEARRDVARVDRGDRASAIARGLTRVRSDAHGP
jgi:hypothetical protein